MAAYDYTFEAGFTSYGCKEASVAFANCETRGKGRCWGGGFNGIVKEGYNVVGYVVVEPGEDCAGFVGQGGEWACELAS